MLTYVTNGLIFEGNYEFALFSQNINFASIRSSIELIQRKMNTSVCNHHGNPIRLGIYKDVNLSQFKHEV